METLSGVRKPKQSSLHISSLLAVGFILALVSPFVSHVGHGLVAAWLLYLSWIILVTLEAPSIWDRVLREAIGRKLELLMYACWLAIIFVNVALGRGYSGIVQLEIALTVGMVLLMDLVYVAKGDRIRNTLITLLIILLGGEALRSLPVLWSEPLLARWSMFYGASSQLAEHAALASVGEYGLYTGFAIALPIFFALSMGSTRYKRIVLILACIAISIAVILATFMGAILLLAIGLGGLVLLYVWFNRRYISRKRIRFFASLFSVALFGIFIWEGFLSTSSQGMLFTDKVTRQVNSVLESGISEGDLTGRSALWAMSINTFLENPLFGVGPSTNTDNPNMGVIVGGHSSWLDLPAEYGVIGFGFYIAFLLAIFRRVFKRFWESKKDMLALTSLISCFIFLLCGSYNPVTFSLQVEVFFFFFAVGGIRAVKSNRVHHVSAPVQVSTVVSGPSDL